MAINLLKVAKSICICLYIIIRDFTVSVVQLQIQYEGPLLMFRNV